LLSLYDYPEKTDEKYLKIDKDIIYDWKKKVERLEKEIDVKKDLFG
jgi:hypothetical protein